MDHQNVFEDLVADLIYLKKSSGFVSSRVYQADTFLTFIGGDNQVFESIKVRFLSAIRALPDKQQSEILLAAYGLLEGYESISSLKERRIKYGKQLNRKYDTLADREAAGINELALRLLTAYYSGAPLPANLPIPHGGFLLNHLSVVTTMKDRQFVMHQQSRKIISLLTGAIEFAYHSSEHTVITAMSGIKEVRTRHVANGTIHSLVFNETLKRGQEYSFAFKEETTEIQPADIKEDFAGQTFETPTILYRQKVIFKGEQPKVIWTYDKLSRIERPAEPDEINMLQLDGDNQVQYEFRQLHGGLCSGIAWRWE